MTSKGRDGPGQTVKARIYVFPAHNYAIRCIKQNGALYLAVHVLAQSHVIRPRRGPPPFPSQEPQHVYKVCVFSCIRFCCRHSGILGAGQQSCCGCMLGALPGVVHCTRLGAAIGAKEVSGGLLCTARHLLLL